MLNTMDVFQQAADRKSDSPRCSSLRPAASALGLPVASQIVISEVRRQRLHEELTVVVWTEQFGVLATECGFASCQDAKSLSSEQRVSSHARPHLFFCRCAHTALPACAGSVQVACLSRAQTIADSMLCTMLWLGRHIYPVRGAVPGLFRDPRTARSILSGIRASGRGLCGRYFPFVRSSTLQLLAGQLH
jgi:hypothetical protein